MVALPHESPPAGASANVEPAGRRASWPTWRNEWWRGFDADLIERVPKLPEWKGRIVYSAPQVLVMKSALL